MTATPPHACHPRARKEMRICSNSGNPTYLIPGQFSRPLPSPQSIAAHVPDSRLAVAGLVGYNRQDVPLWQTRLLSVHPRGTGAPWAAFDALAWNTSLPLPCRERAGKASDPDQGIGNSAPPGGPADIPRSGHRPHHAPRDGTHRCSDTLGGRHDVSAPGTVWRLSDALPPRPTGPRRSTMSDQAGKRFIIPSPARLRWDLPKILGLRNHPGNQHPGGKLAKRLANSAKSGIPNPRFNVAGGGPFEGCAR
jgi:hypothetical protein